MFKDDINRQINGVIQVEQNQESVVEQEIKEYVVTSELKKHFNSFFEGYSESFDTPTDNTGVWITGFFGSGKSHFLKMLSYILENKVVGGKHTVDYFREKFDDELSFMAVQKATSVPTETILFNIDVEGPMEKDATAVLRVFATVFYNHLGFYGRDLKVAKLEQFISKQGKYDEFKKSFEELNGDSWESVRPDYAFFEDDIIDTLVSVLGMSREAAKHWFDGTEKADISVGQLVDEIKEYVDSKPKKFRLVFLVDEVGQYVGTDSNLLVNLQTIIEKVGSVCNGQVWVIATGQEALDEMIKVREDQFSKIMARFKIRLSLTSSSVGEVIEKRLLSKTKPAETTLETVYNNNDAVLRNLYTFSTNRKDIRGYKSSDEFVRQYPFVPYQFIIMQDVFNEIRKHGHTGKFHSHGERSMLNGFQESAQAVQNSDEFTLVPLYVFYDTIHSSLDTSVRSVIERAEKVTNEKFGLYTSDVNLLKLLYLIRYIDDIPSNIDNLTILMADDIRVDKLQLKENINRSLDRLINQNYVARNGDVYTFLTDEEQDIERDIKNTQVDSSGVVSKIGDLIFDDIYQKKKHPYKGKRDFEFDSYVDGQLKGIRHGGMVLQFYTAAADSFDTQEFKLIQDSQNNKAICVLSTGHPYYENIEQAAKIRKYIKQKNVSQLPTSVQKIIQFKQEEASRLEKQARDDIKQAIVDGKYYIQGEQVTFSGTDAANKITAALDNLVEHTYTRLGYVEEPYDSEQVVRQILKGLSPVVDGVEVNKQANADILGFLEGRAQYHISTTMFDIQDKYQAIPYGWKEIEVAGVIARLVVDQKVVIKVNGQVITADDYQMVDYLRKKSEIGKTQISKREKVKQFDLNNARAFLRDYFDTMSVPTDEDTLFNYIKTEFIKKQVDFANYKSVNQTRHYPGYDKILSGDNMVNEILKCSNDGIALISKVNELSDDLLDNKEDMADVVTFFSTQKNLFDNATEFNKNINSTISYYSGYPDVLSAIAKIKDIITYKDNYDYKQIKDLNGLMSTVNTVKAELVSAKRTEADDVISQCISTLETKAKTNLDKLSDILVDAKTDFANRQQSIAELDDLALLDASITQLWAAKDAYLTEMDKALQPVVPKPIPPVPTPPKKVKKSYRNVLLQQKKLSSKEDIDKYVEELRKTLNSYLDDYDEIEIQ